MNYQQCLMTESFVKAKLTDDWKMEAVHIYQNADGGFCYGKLRLEKEGAKEIWPFHFEGEAVVFKEPEFNGSKPLYNQIAIIQAGMEEIIWVVEGEKCVDALSAIGLIATTSGSANSAGYTDWSILAGKKIVIWPDHDEIGKQYAMQVYEILQKLNCKVEIINTEVLGIDIGQDCYDWIQAHIDDDLETIKDLPKIAFAELYQIQTKWPDIMPLSGKQEVPAEFPIDALGDFLSKVAFAVIEATQAPKEICCQSILAAVALATQGLADVEVDGRVCPTSCYFISVAESGDRKTAVDRLVLQPIQEYQRCKNDIYRQQYKAWQADSSQTEKPLEPFILVEEPTTEGLIKAFENGQPSMGLFSDEGGRLIGGYSMKENFVRTIAELSHLWDGKTISRMRSTQPSVLLYGKRLSIHLMLQPNIAAYLLQNELAQSQGVLSRFLISSPLSNAGTRTYKDYNIQNQPAYQNYLAQLKAMLSIDLPMRSNTRNELELRRLKLSPPAKDVYVDFHNKVEFEIGKNGKYRQIKSLASKAAEHALRLAGILTLITQPQATMIEADAMKNAVCLVEYYLQEALRIRNFVVDDPAVIAAKQVLAWLQQQSGDIEPLSRIYQHSPIRQAKKARQAMRLLEEHGYVRRYKTNDTTASKKEQYEMNPAIFNLYD